MKVYVNDRKVTTQGNLVFVDIGNSYLLCIGTKEEVEKATIDEIYQMICCALARREYNNIKTSDIVH